jgi:hypothetical protein
MFRDQALTILVTDSSHLQRLHYSVLSVSNPAGGSLLIHRIETCSSSTQLRSLAHNNEGELSHPAQTNIMDPSCEFLDPHDFHVQRCVTSIAVKIHSSFDKYLGCQRPLRVVAPWTCLQSGNHCASLL